MMWFVLGCVAPPVPTTGSPTTVVPPPTTALPTPSMPTGDTGQPSEPPVGPPQPIRTWTSPHFFAFLGEAVDSAVLDGVPTTTASSTSLPVPSDAPERTPQGWCT
jgi:hypothetical protein